jgi:acyl dehydratase
MNTKLINGIEELRACVGQELGVSEWHTIDQDQISEFAAATGDDYWLHIDPERAKDTSFKSTIAHGLLTLSLGPKFSYEIYQITGVPMSLNYGYGMVRFPSAVPVGSRVRMRARLQSVEEAPNGLTCTITQTFERDGSDKPVCVAESLIRVITR